VPLAVSLSASLVWFLEPVFDPRYMHEGVDLDVLTEMVKFVRSLSQTAPLKDMIVAELSPGPEVKDED